MLFAAISILFFLLQAALQGVYAKCCRESYEATCGDGSRATPCCGYNACNGFCCACPGVEIIREVVYSYEITPTHHTFKWTSVITAPAGTAWTCRASHITTWYPPPQVTGGQCKREDPTKIRLRDENDLVATITHATPPQYDPSILADVRDTFTHVDGGRTHNDVNVINLDDYFGYFNVTADRKGTDFANSVENKFHAHDVNGDGVLTLEEVELRCDSDGCT